MQELHKIKLRGTVDDNFWEVNPELNVIGEIKTLREKIGDDDKSSKLMWSLWMLYNYESPLRTLKFEERLLDICTNYLQDDIYKYESFMEWYAEAFKSEEHKMLDKWEKDLKEREEFFDTKLQWSKENIKIKEDMLKMRGKFMDEYLHMKAKVNQQVVEKGNWGDYEESFSEKGGFDYSIGDE